MSAINVESIDPCPKCGTTATVSEACYLCGAEDPNCRGCAGSGKLRTCTKCGIDRSRATSSTPSSPPDAGDRRRREDHG